MFLQSMRFHPFPYFPHFPLKSDPIDTTPSGVVVSKYFVSGAEYLLL